MKFALASRHHPAWCRLAIRLPAMAGGAWGPCARRRSSHTGFRATPCPPPLSVVASACLHGACHDQAALPSPAPHPEAAITRPCPGPHQPHRRPARHWRGRCGRRPALARAPSAAQPADRAVRRRLRGDRPAHRAGDPAGGRAHAPERRARAVRGRPGDGGAGDGRYCTYCFHPRADATQGLKAADRAPNCQASSICLGEACRGTASADLAAGTCAFHVPHAH
ncbi:hypothetical protein G6F68_012655 [Rhizopus microsporus]|nr:hypothetical protein G6F68_012655 [Rhizopus microsporus]